MFIDIIYYSLFPFLLCIPLPFHTCFSSSIPHIYFCSSSTSNFSSVSAMIECTYYKCLCRMVTTTVTCQPSTVRALTPHHLTRSSRVGLPPVLDWPWGMACVRPAISTKHLKSELWQTIHPFIQTIMTRK